MPRPPRDTIASAHLGRVLKKLHRQHGKPSYKAIYERILIAHEVSCGDEQVRKMHVGEVDPRTTAIEHLLAVAWYYDVEPSDLHPVVAERLAKVLVLAGEGGPDDPSEQGIPATRWSPVTTLDEARRTRRPPALPQPGERAA